MFFSVGYGRDGEGKLTMNFGPLNGDGGHRRLNVAITRARRSVRLYTSILPEDIDPDRAKSRGARLLRSYLRYAREGVRIIDEEGIPAPPGPATAFEQAVEAALAGEGLSVARRLGASAFRLDLAIAPPGAPDRHLLGIECDGPTYRDAATTRDRDRTRPLVLERLGWRFLKVWSTDWVRSPRLELERILHETAEASVSLPVPPPPPPPSAAGTSAGEESAPAPDLPDVEPYRVTPRSRLRARGPFREESTTILRMVGAVVQAEGPVHREVVARRVADAYDTRLTAKVREAVAAAIETVEREGGLRCRGEFLWSPDLPQVTLRGPTDDGETRPVEHVPPEEIAEGIRLVLEVDLRLPRESLVKAVARLLGYRRTTDGVEQRLAAVLDDLLDRGEVTESEGIVARPD
jgi:very-short-patch-repair endonuclease